MSWVFTRECIQQLQRDVEQRYPEEACGLILKSTGEPSLFEVWSIPNVSKTPGHAFSLCPDGFLKGLLKAERSNQSIWAIYHSHPDAGAYFSEMDQREQVLDGTPKVPGAYQLVIEVRDGKAKRMAMYEWSSLEKGYVVKVPAL